MAAPMILPAEASAFLAAHGWDDADIRPLAGDASFRRYFRVRRGGTSAVLMDAPPDKEDVRPFVAVAEWLHSVGLSAPEILARDVGQGLGAHPGQPAVELEVHRDVRMQIVVTGHPLEHVHRGRRRQPA